jgi:hypothetical protein
MEKDKSKTSFVNGTGKVHFTDNLEISCCPDIYKINKFFYTEIERLLFNSYKGIIKVPGLTVNRFFGLRDEGLREIYGVETESGLLNVYEEQIYTEFEYKNILYLGKLYSDKDSNKITNYYLSVTCKANQVSDSEIDMNLVKEAFQYSSKYNKGAININFFGEYESLNNISTDNITVPQSDLRNVFINEKIKDDVNRFIYTFKNFGKFSFPLRYLLSGKPGLGKTEVMRVIINSCAEYGCVIIPKNMRGYEWMSFEFAKLFKPALICIDDIDLLFGQREEIFARKSLGKFLNALDGIIENKVFVVATTNDKKMIDIAASRPGRFDEVIDFGDFEKKYYLDLIKRKTNDEMIIGLFDGEILDFMESKKVTGAYIVNLIKQLKIMVDMNPCFSKLNMLEYLQRNYMGFYKSQLKDEKAFGFGGKREI